MATCATPKDCGADVLVQAGPGVLVITAEPLGARMAGPAIRALELARALARDGRCGAVVLASLSACERTDHAVRLVAAPDEAALRRLVEQAGSVVLQGDVLGRHPWLAHLDLPIVVDAYDPFHLEQLEQARPRGETQRRVIVRDCVRALNQQLGRADLLLCAALPQRSLWIGHLAALGRVNPLTYDAAADLSELVRVVPFGVPDGPPPDRDRQSLREVFPDLADEDVVLVWGGGIYAWFDPGTVLRAVARLIPEFPGLRLLFLGTAHPVPGVHTAATSARELAAELGLTDRTVRFHEGWVPYDDRADWLRAADVGVSAHHPGVETEFSFRTRLVDYLWCGLPVVTTEGDELAQRVVRAGAGDAVPASDVDAWGTALRALVKDPERRARLGLAAAGAAADLAWSRVAEPLADFCAEPRRAPDLVLDVGDRALVGVGGLGAGAAGFSPYARAAAVVREGGAGLLVRRLLHRARRAARGQRSG
jgi:glycosyltransferase involved in cell wall biosynthesis